MQAISRTSARYFKPFIRSVQNIAAKVDVHIFEISVLIGSLPKRALSYPEVLAAKVDVDTSAIEQAVLEVSKQAASAVRELWWLAPHLPRLLQSVGQRPDKYRNV